MFSSNSIAKIVFATGIATSAAFSCTAFAQSETPSIFNPLLPAQPSSSDNLIFRVINPNLGCKQGITSLTNQRETYRIKMESNHITIKFSLMWMEPQISTLPIQEGPQIPTEAQIGRLPPGNYTLSTEGLQCGRGNVSLLPEYQHYAFTVTDGRALKALPFVVLDYSGHWYDPADPGWGVFISQDSRDNILAAFFTYSADGKPAWYVFQPKWELPFRTQTADLWQTAKPPGTTSPPMGSTQLIPVGRASLDFLPVGKRDIFGNVLVPDSFDATEVKGRIAYKFGDGPVQEKNLVRFGTR